MTGPVQWRRDDDLLIVTIDNPPVNAASQSVRQGLLDALQEAAGDHRTKFIVITGSGRSFVAGADINEFGKPPLSPSLAEVTLAIETSAKPVLAALNGTALGGGLEIALACHGRIATAGAKLGLPEVTLGIIPGAGGTQRLPRLIGLPRALEMICGGKPIGATEALQLGLLDRVISGDVIDAAKSHLKDATLRATGALPVATFDRAAVQQRINEIEQRARGQQSPAEAARAVMMAADLPLELGLAQEYQTVQRLIDSEQAAALRYAFFAERAAGKVEGLEEVAPRRLRVVGVAGAGLMGAGIAVCAADAGYDLVVVEQNELAAEQGRARILALYDRQVKNGRISPAQRQERLERIRISANRQDFAGCDLVIEAIIDDLAAKQDLFAAIEPIIGPDAMLATNTSYLDPDQIASVLRDPSRLAGLHFFSPANVMRLVEVVRGASTKDDVLRSCIGFSKSLAKLPVVCRVGEGFIGNRIFSAYRRLCDEMLEDGAWPEQIDQALQHFGFPMGPYEVTDMAGLEISWARRRRQAAARDPAERYAGTLADRLCESGRFGRKAGRGYYRYDGEQRKIDPTVNDLLVSISAEKNIQRRSFSDEQIVAVVLAGMAAEGQRLLADNVAQRASDIDLVLIHGYGFPAWRGGPMFLEQRR